MKRMTVWSALAGMLATAVHGAVVLQNADWATANFRTNGMGAAHRVQGRRELPAPPQGLVRAGGGGRDAPRRHGDVGRREGARLRARREIAARDRKV